MEKLSKEQLEELRKYDTPTVCNALESFGVRGRLEGYANPGMVLRVPYQKPMVGYAATARISGIQPGKKEMMMNYYEHVREMDDPTIAVIQDTDEVKVGSFWGEVNATVHKALGAVGTLTDGGVRDLKEVENLGFYFFSTELVVSHGNAHVDEYGCPVTICGLEVLPGDLLHADYHGITIIPPEIAPHLAEACKKAAAAEMPMLEPCRKAIADGVKPQIADIQCWRAAMDQKRKEME